MKLRITALLVLLSSFSLAQTPPAARNIFIVTIDGFRWQEVFGGADPDLIRDAGKVKDTLLLCRQFWDEDATVRRSKLLPFFWSVIAKDGQLLGNRDYGNDMNAANLFKISYPGYNEIFTGYADPRFIPNLQVNNRNINVLEYLNATAGYHGKVAAFSSWNVLPFILNEEATGLPVNSGYEPIGGDDTLNVLIDAVQRNVAHRSSTRQDQLTFASARNFIIKEHPRVLYLGLGETDEFAHKGEYDRYLQKAHQADEMIAELWYMIQTDPFYKDSTTLIIATDHGRGRRDDTWNKHGFWIGGSGETWMAAIGAGIYGSGERKDKQQRYLKQIAATVSGLLGETFTANHPVGEPIRFSK